MKYIVDRFLSQKAKLHLEVPGEVAVVGVPEEEGQEADLGVDFEVIGGAEALRVLAFKAVSGTEELLEVVQEAGL